MDEFHLITGDGDARRLERHRCSFVHYKVDVLRVERCVRTQYKVMVDVHDLYEDARGAEHKVAGMFIEDKTTWKKPAGQKIVWLEI